MVKSRTAELETSERTLKQTLDNLEELVQKRTVELAYANTMLSKEIEERKNFEVILAESEIRFRKLINEGWDMILLTDREGDITFISASVNKLLGYTEKDVVGQQWTNFVNNEDFHYGVKEFLEKQTDTDNAHSVVFRAYHKDGTQRWLEANLINMVDDPSVEAIVAHCRDITEKKAAEEELNNYSQQLEVLNTAKDKLFSIIAHDLRSPFTAILGYASILKVDSNRMSREEINRCATSIETAVKNTLILIESLLDWSRTQLGGIEFNPKPLNLNEIVLEIFYLLHPDAVNKRIALKSDIQTDKTVNADENLLKTTIRNLVHNAIKFTRPDGQVMLTSKTIDGFEEISITDTGIGIPEENIEDIFKLHSQASRRGTANERGTGLGLTLCKEFIEKHGGSIHVSSKVDSGTTFTFTIPLPKAT
jgi:PAS domain S-box-containing protein